METTVSERGQTAVPAVIRRRHHIKPHTKLVWLDLGKTISVIPETEDPVETLRGMFKGKGLTKSLLEERKQERDREKKADEHWIHRRLPS
jgi:bifunctional DNA-binding transcriptional regulator/antitoxin component of YhaV-PrlF toxin-antitoxin module